MIVVNVVTIFAFVITICHSPHATTVITIVIIIYPYQTLSYFLFKKITKKILKTLRVF